MADNKSSEVENVLHKCVDCKKHRVLKNGVDGKWCEFCNGFLEVVRLTKESASKPYEPSETAYNIRALILERTMNHLKGLTPKQIDDLIDLYEECKRLEELGEASNFKNSRSVEQLHIDVDVSDALKGLKAVQREARQATKALRELEEQQMRVDLR